MFRFAILFNYIISLCICLPLHEKTRPVLHGSTAEISFDLRELLQEDFVPGLFILPVARSV